MIFCRKISFKTVTIIIVTSVFLCLINLCFILKLYSNNNEEEDILSKTKKYYWNNEEVLHKNRTISVIFSSWRTGSTFLGDIVNSVPGTYYHFEPFNFELIRQQETNDENSEFILNLLNCHYDSPFAKKHIGIHYHWYFNKRMSKYCGNFVERYCGDLCGNNLCNRVSFRERFCNFFPRQLMKLVRARVSLAETLLSNTNLDVRIILEVRDPRVVYNLRKSFWECKKHPDCYSIERFCEFQVQDYYDVQVLLEKYPNRIQVLRYKKLASDPWNESKKLLSFLHLPFTSEVQEFLETHTKHKQEDIFSTYRDSKKADVHWMKDLKKEEIEYVQDVCQKAMKLWGYKTL